MKQAKPFSKLAAIGPIAAGALLATIWLAACTKPAPAWPPNVRRHPDGSCWYYPPQNCPPSHLSTCEMAAPQRVVCPGAAPPAQPRPPQYPPPGQPYPPQYPPQYPPPAGGHPNPPPVPPYPPPPPG